MALAAPSVNGKIHPLGYAGELMGPATLRRTPLSLVSSGGMACTTGPCQKEGDDEFIPRGGGENRIALSQ